MNVNLKRLLTSGAYFVIAAAVVYGIGMYAVLAVLGLRVLLTFLGKMSLISSYSNGFDSKTAVLTGLDFGILCYILALAS